MIATTARLENSLRTPNNTTLHLEREDKGLKARVYTGFTDHHMESETSVASNTLHPIKRTADNSQLPPAGLLLRELLPPLTKGFRALQEKPCWALS
jgi:hypothetical protein